MTALCVLQAEGAPGGLWHGPVAGMRGSADDQARPVKAGGFLGLVASVGSGKQEGAHPW